MKDARLANDAWEALFRSQVALSRAFENDEIWGELTQVEYDVLYNLSKAPGGMSMAELNRGILMTQGGVSRLVARLESRGLVRRSADPEDGRATCLALTEQGSELQRTVGRRLAAAVTATMTRILDHDQLIDLKALGEHILRELDASPTTRSATKAGGR
jgi:DNA-binding MarR family transcriptional regulator